MTLPALRDTSKTVRLVSLAALGLGAPNVVLIGSTRTYQSAPIPHAAISLKDEPLPITMLVSSNRLAADSPNFPLEQPAYVGSGPAVGQASFAGAGLAGIELKYGAGSAVRTVVMDLRPGAYQLPASTFATASIIAYRDPATAVFLARDVGISFVAGLVHPTPTRPTVTAGFTNGAGGGALGMTIMTPAQARWFNMWAEVSGAWAFGAAAAPILELQTGAGGDDASEKVYRNYVTGEFVPNWGPIEWAGYAGSQLSFGNLNAATAANVYFWSRFWLEL